MKTGKYQMLMLLAAVVVLLLAALLALWQIDISRVTWVKGGEGLIETGQAVRDRPLVVTPIWYMLPAGPQGQEYKATQISLRLAPDTDYVLSLRCGSGLLSANANGQELYQQQTPLFTGDQLFHVRSGPQGELTVALRLEEPARMAPPVMMLGEQGQVLRLLNLRLACFFALSAIIMAGGAMMLINYLTQGREITDLTVWLLYMLLLLAQVDVLLPQSQGAWVTRQSAMLLTCACMACYASLCLGRAEDGPVLLVALFAAMVLVLLWLGSYVLAGREVAISLALPMQVLFLLVAAWYTLSGIQREEGWKDPERRMSAIALCLLLVALAADFTKLRTYAMLVPPVLAFGAAMAIVHMWMLCYRQALSRRKREALEADLERRVLDRTEELYLANEQLSRIDALRGEFFSHLAHDLQSPLTIIRGSLDLVLDDTPVTEAERDNYLRMARTNTVKLASRIKALRGLALLEETAFNPKAQPVKQVMAQCITNWGGMYRDSGIVFACEGPDIQAVFDASWLLNALERLVSNAVRYTPAGGSVTVSWKQATFGVQLSVADTGCGIAAADLPGLFQRFYKGWNSQDGSGIGLAVVQRVAQRHNGRVWVESEPGKGSTFAIYLPDLAAHSYQPPATAS